MIYLSVKGLTGVEKWIKDQVKLPQWRPDGALLNTERGGLPRPKQSSAQCAHPPPLPNSHCCTPHRSARTSRRRWN